MGNVFDLCPSRKKIESETIVIENPMDKEFCKICQNGWVTEAKFPSGFKVPSKKYGLDWMVRDNKLILKKKN